MDAGFSMSGAEEMQISVEFNQYSFECPEADVVDSFNRFFEHVNPPLPLHPPPKKNENVTVM